MSLRGWPDPNRPAAVPPPVPVAEPMSRDRPPADFDDDRRPWRAPHAGGYRPSQSTPEPSTPPAGPAGTSAPLTTVRVRLSTEVDRPPYARVEIVARDGLARDVLVGRAVPLLARARRMLDQLATADFFMRPRVEKLSDEIAALIGHDVTGRPAAPELEAVLAEGTPARLTREQLDELPDNVMVPSTAMPLESDVPAQPVETAQARAARYERINEALERMGVEVIPPCPMAPYAESSESATPTGSEGVDARELPPHNLSMPHRIARPGLPDSEMIAWEQGVEGCPPGCPRRLAALDCCSSCWGMLEEPPRRACQYTGAHKVAARLLAEDVDVAPRIGPPITLRESREPATPVETPTARATRLDREARDTQKAYARAVQAADGAWRELGGRP